MMTTDELIKQADAWLHHDDDADDGVGEHTTWEDAWYRHVQDTYGDMPIESIICAYKETTEDPGAAKENWGYEHKPGDTWYKEIGRIKVTLQVEVITSADVNQERE